MKEERTREYESLPEEIYWTFTGRFLIFGLHESDLYIYETQLQAWRILNKVYFCLLWERMLKCLSIWSFLNDLISEGFSAFVWRWLKLMKLNLVMAEGLKKKLHIKMAIKVMFCVSLQNSLELIKKIY